MYTFNFCTWKHLFWDFLIKPAYDKPQAELFNDFIFDASLKKTDSLNTVASTILSGKVSFNEKQRTILNDVSYDHYLNAVKSSLDIRKKQDETIEQVLRLYISSLGSLIEGNQIEIDINRKSDLIRTLKDSDICIEKKIVDLLLYAISEPNSEVDKSDFLNLINGDHRTPPESHSMKIFCGQYYIYYYSAHYADEIHCGLLRIYPDTNNKLSARLIFGLVSPEKLKNEKLLKALNAEKNTDAMILFNDFKNNEPSRYYQRIYLFHGELTGTHFTLQINFSGSGSEADVFQTLYLNVTRANMYAENNRNTVYKGGLGLMVVSPHRSSQKLRAYRMGLSDIELDINNPQLQQMLDPNPTKYHRIQIQLDDDSEWFDLRAKMEAESLKESTSHNYN